MNASPTSLEKRFRQELNTPQYEAVTHQGSSLLVLAGAGSGKTRVITYRIAYLIEAERLAPWNILAVTFTNKAAKEMRDRVSILLGGVSRGLWIGTFHSICARMLRAHGQAIGIDPRFTIYDRGDQTAAVKQAKTRCNVGSDKEFKPAAILHQISQAKSRFEGPTKLEDDADNDFALQIAKLYREYQIILQENNALDFDDLLVRGVKLLANDPEAGGVYRKRFRHVLVDEYQDTNHAQHLFLHELVKDHHRICAVGDDDQSIYRWRGANIENILNFNTAYPNTKIVRMEQNYRSTKTILAAAAHVVKNNTNRHPKTLWTDGETGEKVKIINLFDQNAEAYWIGDEIQRLNSEQKIPYGHQAIFYRTNAQSRLFEEECVKRGIPYSIVGATAFYQRKEIKDAIAYARMLVNPSDVVSFERIVNVPKRKLGKKSVQTLIDYASRTKISILQAAAGISSVGRESGLGPAALKAFDRFARMIDRWRSLAADLSLLDLVETILRESGYLAMLENSLDPQDRAREENLEELVGAIGIFEEDFLTEQDASISSLVTLQAYLENAALVSDVDQMKDSDEAVIMMTLHAAKGLEFPAVYMVGMEEGLFPHERSLFAETDAEMEEERRLCYVGITRARERIYMTHASSRRIYNQQDDHRRISRFIDEIPQDYKETISCNSAMDHLIEPIGEDLEGKDNCFVPGDMVNHRTFGFGVVVAVEGEDGNARITVDFQQWGEKLLAQAYARLVKV